MATPNPADSLIAERYSVELSRPLPGLGGGLPAFNAIDRKSGDGRLVALAADRYASPRLRCLQHLDRPIDNLMVPVAFGVGPRPGGGQGFYVICNAPLGQPVSAELAPWPEASLLENVLRPIAQVLIALEEAGVTHRAIRPNNVFALDRAHSVTLGAAWAAPPALHQPAVFEPPFSALCHPAGRGDGTIADDIYALGVLLIVLATGKVPLADIDDDAIIRRKLDLGSFAVLTGGAALPPYLSDLLRGMLADDPDHRSPARLLMDPTTARARRVAARPPRRSQRPLHLNDAAVFDARSLAYALSRDERTSVQALRAGAVSHWLRRGLGDGTLAAAVEELVRVRSAEGATTADADSRLLMHAISTVEPRMPFCWREISFWPDALGALLAEGFRADPRLITMVEEVLRSDVLVGWEGRDADGHHDDGFLRSFDGRQLRAYLQRNGEGAMLRLLYGINPLIPCVAPGMAEQWIVSMPEMMAFLEKVAAGAGPDTDLLDEHILAFAAARGDRQIAAAINLAVGSTAAMGFQFRVLGLLRDMQVRYLNQKLPALAAWTAARLRPQLETFHNLRTREALIARLDQLAAEGFLARLLQLVEDTTARAEDLAGARRAAALIAAIDREIELISHSGAQRHAMVARLGRETAAAAGMAVLILMLIVAALE